MPHAFPLDSGPTPPAYLIPNLSSRASDFLGKGGLWLALLLLSGAGWASAQQAGTASPPQGVVEGQIEGRSEAGLPVVLLQYRLDSEGQPQGGPIARTQTGEGGTYRFESVPVEASTVYRLGTRIDGRLIASDPFTFPSEGTRVRFDLRLPVVRKDLSTLSAQELLWVAEPRPGSVWITEVVHLSNSSSDAVDSQEAPLSLPIPTGARDFELLRLDDENGLHERLGERLLIRAHFGPGLNVIAFRYRLDAWLGGAGWTRGYPFEVARARLLAPLGSVRAEGEGFVESAPETFQDVTYAVWAREAVTAGSPLTLRLTGVPVLQMMLLLPLAGFALLMTALLAWFVRRRLRAPAHRPGSAGT